jgi:hypothetical protein
VLAYDQLAQLPCPLFLGLDLVLTDGRACQKHGLFRETLNWSGLNLGLGNRLRDRSGYLDFCLRGFWGLVRRVMFRQLLA